MERCNPSNITLKRRKPVIAGLCYWEKDGAKSECRTRVHELCSGVSLGTAKRLKLRTALKRRARNWADMLTCLAY